MVRRVARNRTGRDSTCPVNCSLKLHILQCWTFGICFISRLQRQRPMVTRTDTPTATAMERIPTDTPTDTLMGTRMAMLTANHTKRTATPTVMPTDTRMATPTESSIPKRNRRSLCNLCLASRTPSWLRKKPNSKKCTLCLYEKSSLLTIDRLAWVEYQKQRNRKVIREFMGCCQGCNNNAHAIVKQVSCINFPFSFFTSNRTICSWWKYDWYHCQFHYFVSTFTHLKEVRQSLFILFSIFWKMIIISVRPNH